MHRAVVLLSGGLDSATTLYWARSQGYVSYALCVSYGQRHLRELSSAHALAQAAGATFQSLDIPMPWKGSALLDRDVPLPQDRSANEMSGGIPATYVPARNTVLLSLGLSWAETIGAESILIGANAIDYSGYPDCRPGYLRALEEAFRQGTRCGLAGKPVRILAPLIEMTKADIVRLAVELGVPLELTWSCYEGNARPCGRCDACLLRAKGFAEAGVEDPLWSTQSR